MRARWVRPSVAETGWIQGVCRDFGWGAIETAPPPPPPRPHTHTHSPPTPARQISFPHKIPHLHNTDISTLLLTIIPLCMLLEIF